MKIIFGNVNIKIPNEKYLKSFSSRENPFKSMFSKYNPDFFSNLYKEISPSMMNYFEEFKRKMEKYTKRMN